MFLSSAWRRTAGKAAVSAAGGGLKLRRGAFPPAGRSPSAVSPDSMLASRPRLQCDVSTGAHTLVSCQGAPPHPPPRGAGSLMGPVGRVLVHVCGERAAPRPAAFLQVASAGAGPEPSLHEDLSPAAECDGGLQRRGRPGGGAVFSGQTPLPHRWGGRRSGGPAEGRAPPAPTVSPAEPL